MRPRFPGLAEASGELDVNVDEIGTGFPREAPDMPSSSSSSAQSPVRETHDLGGVASLDGRGGGCLGASALFCAVGGGGGEGRARCLACVSWARCGRNGGRAEPDAAADLGDGRERGGKTADARGGRGSGWTVRWAGMWLLLFVYAAAEAAATADHRFDAGGGGAGAGAGGAAADDMARGDGA